MASPEIESSGGRHVSSSNPLPLSATQEAQVRDLYYKNVRAKCGEEIRGLTSPMIVPPDIKLKSPTEFAMCAANRTISATWACRQQRLSMNGCMVQYATQKMLDEAREQWFFDMEARKKEREEMQKEKILAEEFHKKWWRRDQKCQ